MSLEVVAKLVPREDHRVEQLLDLWITRLCLGQNLADVVYWPLDWQGMPSSVRSATMTALTTWVVTAT
jgi:hypothetical protein